MLVTIDARESVQSTMDAAHDRAAAGAAHGTTVWARRQTAGRGTRGRRWAADDGGLWLSVVAHPARTDALETLSVRVGIAVAAALEVACPGIPSLGLKWPNDILLEGRKVAGVLCEARWSGDRCQWVVVGVGVNVTNPLDDALHAATIGRWVGSAGVDGLVEPVARAVAIAAGDAGPLGAAELAICASRDVLRGRRALEPVRGTIAGIARDGSLTVRTDSGGTADVLAGLVVALD